MAQVIDSAASLLRVHYNDSLTGEKIARVLEENYAEGKYTHQTSYTTFTEAVQSDLSQVSGDQHFHFLYDPKAIAASKESGEHELLNNLLKDERINFGFEEVRILPGNIGYLKLNRFPYPSDVGDVYILISNRTFSAGEWFAFGMQEYKRAKIIGEVSKGGATPSDVFYINENFMMMIPNTVCTSPISNSHFNNKGVHPDLLCDESEAFHRAYQMALLKADSLQKDPQIKYENQWHLDAG